MATPILTPDEWLQKVKDELKYIYSRKYQEAEGGVHEKRAACWAVHRQLKPSELFPSEFPMIDFQNGRDNPDTLKKELKVALKGDRKNESAAEESINTFVRYFEDNKMLDPVSVSLKGDQAQTGQKDYPQYISCKVIEMSLARLVIWETDYDNFWDLEYEERRLIEASRLHSLCKNNGNVPAAGKTGDLLPVMYWKKNDGSWASSTEEGEQMLGENGQLPKWATDYIEKSKIALGPGKEMQLFDDAGDRAGDNLPNTLPYAVYLLLCRFNGKGVHEDARVQAYAGRAKHGVEERWAQHARLSKVVVENYSELETFNAEPLHVSQNAPKHLLVDVIVSRLYAQGGRKYITEIDVKSHDNIVLFVYRTYGTEKEMKIAETDLIEKLKLKDMKRGMNGHR